MSESNMTDLQQDWKPPAELAGSGPREIRLTGAGIAIACVSVFFFLAAIGAAVGFTIKRSHEVADREELRASGFQTDGVVTRHWRSSDKDHTPYVAYAFTYEGRQYDARSSVPEAIWRGLAVGSPIAVRVSRLRPELSHPADYEMEVLPSWFPAFFGALLAGSGVLLTLMLRRQSRLLSEGTAAPGRVTGYRRVKGGKMLRYQFTVRSGAIITGQGGHTRRPPPVGSSICVVYDRENPKRNTVYPMHLVRVDR